MHVDYLEDKHIQVIGDDIYAHGELVAKLVVPTSTVRDEFVSYLTSPARNDRLEPLLEEDDE